MMCRTCKKKTFLNIYCLLTVSLESRSVSLSHGSGFEYRSKVTGLQAEEEAHPTTWNRPDDTWAWTPHWFFCAGMFSRLHYNWCFLSVPPSGLISCKWFVIQSHFGLAASMSLYVLFRRVSALLIILSWGHELHNEIDPFKAELLPQTHLQNTRRNHSQRQYYGERVCLRVLDRHFMFRNIFLHA